jgi:DNA invertase Pin-like site-specific DNA recombinase
MVAAIYARRSTEQNGADADAKSVARQVDNARAFVAARGWTVDAAHVYVDDAVSGAETRKLVNRQRLLDAIDAGPAFHVLVMRDASRFSRRDGDEAFGELKRLAQAGIAVWFYQDGTQFEYGTMGDNVVGFVRAEMNAEFRRQIAKWTYDALRTKAAKGYVTGGRCFGYDNARVNGHVERRINDTEAAVVVRIFESYAAGHGLGTIAKQLNEQSAFRPSPQQGRPAGWAPSSVREILRRPLYRGQIVWNRSKKRDKAGQLNQSRRRPEDWLRVDQPELRIVSVALTDSVDARLGAMRSRMLRLSDGRLLGRPPGEGARYLLTGLLTCADCGGGFEALSRASGRRRAFVYGCATHRRKGACICANGLVAPMEDADASVLQTVEETLLNPAIIGRALAYAEAAPPRGARSRLGRRREGHRPLDGGDRGRRRTRSARGGARHV